MLFFCVFHFTGNIDSQNKHSSITNGICCSTNSKYGTSKSGRKNSNLSQLEYDKRPLNNNNNNRCNDIEHFDSIEQIITNANTGTLKNKKTAHQSKSKDRKKLHGSLPNHLDTDATDVEGSDDTNSSGKCIFSFSLLLFHFGFFIVLIFLFFVFIKK